jgi:hypothetical protein
MNGYVECKTPACDRDVRPPNHPSSHPVFCCHACGLAHLGGYAIETGPLAHSSKCNWRRRWGLAIEPKEAILRV